MSLMRSLFNTLRQAEELAGWYSYVTPVPGKEVECYLELIREALEEYERKLRCPCL